MSLNYARELLKISISQLCDAIGFDTTSEMAMDILVDVCERQFQYLAKQTSNLIQLNHRYQPNFLDLLTILLDQDQENFHQLYEYMKHFQTLTFSQEIIQFPYQKRNQFFLRIPPKDSQQVLEREQNQSTEYIYDWLPLFPDQETPEQPSTINGDINLDATIDNDQEKQIEKSDPHHPLTLLSFLSKNGDESNPVPIGKKPNRSLPSILYRPRRIIEMEAVAAAAAAAEKAKKEQLEKENTEKDQQQGPPPPLRLTIPKPVVTNDKPSLPVKKLPPTTTTTPVGAATENTISKKSSSTSLLNTISPSVNLGKKIIVSPPINNSNETHSQLNSSTHLSESLTNLEKNDDVVLDLSKPTSTISTPAKVPSIKLNIKNVTNPPTNNHSEIPLTATKKIQRPTTTTPKPSTGTHEKVNLKIRTSSLPLFGSTSGRNDPSTLISPPLVIPSESRTSSSIESSSIVHGPILENKQTTEMIDSINGVDQSISTEKTINDEEKKKKKKKKHHDKEEKKDEKKIKIEQENQTIEQFNHQMDIDPILSTTNQSSITTNPPLLPPPPPAPSTQPAAGAIRLKIKFGKPSNNTSTPETNKSDDHPTSTNLNNEHNSNREIKANPIRLTLPLGSNKPSQTISPSRPPIISTLNRTPHRRKSGQVKRVPQSNETNLLETKFSTPRVILQEDNTVSIDDLPLGERTSPTKPIVNNIETNFSQQISSTPIKKKSNIIKKKSTNKRPNNIVGVAVIEERRIHHDSQEKIWICPSCNRPDNGQEAMIACDLCDDWYHWECVGIVEEPPESNPWFCPKCHRSNSSTASAQGIKPSASSKAKRKRASVLYQQQQQQQQFSLI